MIDGHPIDPPLLTGRDENASNVPILPFWPWNPLSSSEVIKNYVVVVAVYNHAIAVIKE